MSFRQRWPDLSLGTPSLSHEPPASVRLKPGHPRLDCYRDVACEAFDLFDPLNRPVTLTRFNQA
ncbi:protein of unknown function [Aminobacter niigataensis]|nr:protein of unknown function [Aminobacter niigataensis]